METKKEIEVYFTLDEGENFLRAHFEEPKLTPTINWDRTSWLSRYARGIKVPNSAVLIKELGVAKFVFAKGIITNMGVNKDE